MCMLCWCDKLWCSPNMNSCYKAIPGLSNWIRGVIAGTADTFNHEIQDCLPTYARLSWLSVVGHIKGTLRFYHHWLIYLAQPMQISQAVFQRACHTGARSWRRLDERNASLTGSHITQPKQVVLHNPEVLPQCLHTQAVEPHDHPSAKCSSCIDA